MDGDTVARLLFVLLQHFLYKKFSWKCHLASIVVSAPGVPSTRPTGLRGNAALSLTHLTQITLLAEPATQSASKSPVKQVFLAYLPIPGYFWTLS